MRHGWKRLAERAWNPAFDDTERCEALAEALRGDWTDEVPQPLVRRLRDVLDDVQGDVFGDPLTVRIEGLRGETRPARSRPRCSTARFRRHTTDVAAARPLKWLPVTLFCSVPRAAGVK